MKADLPRLNPKVFEQEPCISGIFGGNDIHFLEGIDHANAHVVHISNGSRHQIQLAVGRLSLKTLLNLHLYSLNNNSSQNMHSASFSRR